MQDDDKERMREDFTKELNCYYNENHNIKPVWTKERIEEMINKIEQLKSRRTKNNETINDHEIILYDVEEKDGKKILIYNEKKRKSTQRCTVVPTDDYFEVLYSAHLDSGHGGRLKMTDYLKDRTYYIPQDIINMFPKHCKPCNITRYVKRGARPVTICDYKRGFLDIIDMTKLSDEPYYYILYYQDLLTKFTFLRPLKDDSPIAIARELLKIFLDLGSPAILHTAKERKFTEAIVDCLLKELPDYTILVGKDMQIDDDHADRVKGMVLAWMTERNLTNWCRGVYFVQFEINHTVHELTDKTPYKALFGVAPKVGIDTSNMTQTVINSMKDEEDLQKWREEQEKETPLFKRQKSNKKYVPRIIYRHKNEEEDSDTKEKNVESADTDLPSTSIDKDNVWCWVCGQGDGAVTLLCNKCHGAIHVDCGKYIFKKSITCNLCLGGDQITGDNKIEIKLEPMEFTNTDEVVIKKEIKEENEDMSPFYDH